VVAKSRRSKEMINRVSIIAISVMISGMLTSPSHAQTTGWTSNSGHFGALRLFSGLTSEMNRTILPGTARAGELLNPGVGAPAEHLFAFSAYPGMSSSEAASFPVYQNPGTPPGNFSDVFAGAYKADCSTADLLPREETKTLFFTRSSLQLAQFWGGRLRLDGFMGTLNMQNVELGPAAAGGLRDFRPPRENYLHGPRSVDLYGVSVSFHLGRDAGMERPPEVRRTLSRIVGNILG
jgi:hypothetical protein